MNATRTRTSRCIRPLRPDDHDQVRALAPELLTGMATWRPRAGLVGAVSAWVDAAVQSARAGGHAVLVEVEPCGRRDGGDRVRGFVSVGERTHFSGEREAYVGELAVAPADRQQGVARALMAAAEAWGARRGLTRLSLETGSANHVARSAYAAMGYVEEQVTLTKALS